MSETESPRPGTVYLVGAGPGDPKLITLRGVECLRRADAVLYDYLASPGLLDHVRPGAELIGLGHPGGGRLWRPEDITARLVAWARAGKTVVRLKGGDPAVFARLAEEAETLTRAGIPYEIVPGITAALAAASYAGIPVTHRECASAVAFVTGHEDAERAESALDFVALARFPGTLVFYMGVTTAPAWTAALIQAGKPAGTPAAIVRHCSLPDQVTIRCRLDEVAARLAVAGNIRPPVIVIVGAVTALMDTPAWFERRPLFGRRIVVTRPLEQSAALAEQLAELGAEVLLQPAIRISSPRDWRPVDAALARLSSFAWLVFSSANGVRYLLERLLAHGRDLRALAGVRIAAIGPGTADVLSRYHLRADLVPDEFRAEALADALGEQACGRRYLLARASRGREVLAERLRAAGAEVEQVEVYQSTDVNAPDEAIASRLAAGEIHWVTVTSSAIARSLAAMFGTNLQQTQLASISPVTSSTLRELGFAPAVEAREYTMSGICQAILEACGRPAAGPGSP
jgi:uroporphyrinogen III methyltransferase / synthase